MIRMIFRSKEQTQLKRTVPTKPQVPTKVFDANMKYVTPSLLLKPAKLFKMLLQWPEKNAAA